MPVPVDVQLPLLLKVLSTDRNLMAHSEGEIVVGVIYQRNVRESSRIAEAVKDHIGSAPSHTIAGKGTRMKYIAIDDLADLDSRLARDSVDVCYISPLRAASLDSLLAVTRRLAIITCTGVPEYVERGVTVGVGVKGDHPQILVNMMAARAERVEFGSRVLKLARIYSKE
jgi:hypothetical protein